MIALLNWLLLLALCVAIARSAPPTGTAVSLCIMAVVTVIAYPYVEQQLNISWITLAVVASLVLVLAGFCRLHLATKVNTTGRR